MDHRGGRTGINWRVVCWAGLLFACSISSARSQFPTVQLHGWSRCVLPRQDQVVVRPRGVDLDELRHLYLWPQGRRFSSLKTSLGGIAKFSVPTEEFAIDCTDLAPGLHDGMVDGRFGISNPRRLLVVDADVEYLSQPAVDSSAAQTLRPGVVYEANCQARDRQWFRIELESGERLAAVAYAAALDSRATLRLALHDPAGKLVALGHAVRDWPARIDWRAEQAGAHFLEVYDVLYRGGPDFHYALEVVTDHSGTGDPRKCCLDELLLTTLEPGISLPRLKFSELSRLPSFFPNAPHPRFQLANRDDRVLPLLDEHLARPPFSVFLPSLDDASSSLQLPMRKGQTLVCEVRSAQWSQLTDPHLLVYRIADGQGNAIDPPHLVAHQQDGIHRTGLEVTFIAPDPIVTWTAPEDGRYRIEVRDDQRGERPPGSTAAEAEIRSPQPGMAALAWPLFPSADIKAARPQGTHLLRGGTVAFRVLLHRIDGYSGPVRASIEGLPPGTRCYPATIPAGADSGIVLLEAAADAPSWTGPVRILLHPQGEGSQPVEAVAATVQWAATPQRNITQGRLTNHLMLHVAGQDVAPCTVHLGDNAPLTCAVGSKQEITIRITRRDGGDAECIVRPQNLPPNVSLGEVKIPQGAMEATGTLTIAPNTPPGTYTLWAVAEMKVRWRANPQAVERLEAWKAEIEENGETLTSTPQDLPPVVSALAAELERVKQRAMERELTVWLPATPLELRVVPADQP
ncbi:MAG: hypothetical protein KatS3mg111_1139 [Pirellulaceae bacterium]|nr:MAG: hypothetical protein KatS3mg111_1139 [Pirellulaceae bacterium]